jgi:hypothetical protein
MENIFNIHSSNRPYGKANQFYQSSGTVDELNYYEEKVNTGHGQKQALILNVI